MAAIREKYAAIQQRIANAALRAGRAPQDILILAVTKTRSLEQIQEAIDAGISDFGENRIQDALPKIAALSAEEIPSSGNSITWHFIGHLQRNKARDAVQAFSLIHSVDSLRLARELDRWGARLGKPVEILIQMNVSGEESKFGIESTECLHMAGEIAQLKHVRIKGLMTMAPFSENPESARSVFRELRRYAEIIDNARIDGVAMRHLSMGMSNDFEVAVEEGSTIVRIGSALFV